MDKIFTQINELINYLIQKGIRNPDKIAEKLLRNGPVRREDLKKQIEFLLMYEDSQKEDKIIETATTRIYSDELFEAIDIRVKRIRQEVFKSDNIPFSSYDEAIRWIEDKIKEGSIRENRDKHLLFLNKLEELQMLIYNGDAIGRVVEPYEPLFYKMKEIDDGGSPYVGAFVYHSKELQALRNEVSLLEKSTGIKQYELLRYILSGIKPEFVRYEVIEKYSITGKKRIEIIINSPDMTLDELRKIYNKYRETSNLKHKKPITEKQRKILNFIKEYGDPPVERGSLSKYFIKVLPEWNRKYPDNSYTKWQGLYKAYLGLQEKIKRTL